MLTHASGDGPGNLVVLYGSATGRDGIGGASVLASATFGDQDPSKRPSVQVGDPFAEKLLIEATLELIAKGLVVSIQDLGAAGITCATSETADRGGTGMLVDLDAIPRREPGMEPFEVMISESQERMVAIVEPAPLGRRPGRLRALGPARRGHRPGDRGAGHRRADGARRLGRPRRGRRAGRRCRRARAHPRPCPRERGDRVRARVARPAAPPRRARPGCRRRARRTRSRSAARTRAPCCSALLGSANLSSRRAGLRAVRLERAVEHRRRRPAVARRSCGSRGRRRRSSPRPTGTRPSAQHRPVARRGDVRRGGCAQRVDHRRAAARRDELPQLRRPDPAGGVLAALGGGPRPRRTRASPSGCRSPAATSRCTTRRRAPRSRRRPRSGSSACSTTSPRASGPAFRADGQRDPARRRDEGRPRRLGVRAARRRRGRGRPAAARPRARGRGPGVHPRGDRPRPRRRAARTSRVAASRSPSPRCASGATRARPLRVARRRLAGGRAVRREPVAARRRGRAASRACLRAARPPARAPGRRARHHGRRAPRDRARRRRRHRRRRGTRLPASQTPWRSP